MVTLEWLVRFGGVLHLSLLLAAGLVPFVLNWKADLAKVDRLSRQVVWAHGVFIALVIVGFGAASLLLPAELTAGTPLARAFCGFVATFWLGRLGLQAFYFDAESQLNHWFLRLGYRSLSGVFTYFAVVYGVAALAPFTTAVPF